MSAFSKNAFSLLSEDGEVRPQPVPVKEEAKPVEQPKNDKRSPKSAGAKKSAGDKRRGGDKRQGGGRPQRGRQFDRHSATGIVDSEKKEKQGWGHAETAEAEAASDAVNPKDPAAAEETAAPAEAEEEVVKTLDEYLAEKANKNLKVTLPEARKANEGADDAKWKDTVAFAKTEEPEYLPAKEKAAKKEKTVKTKVFVEIEQRFQEKPRFQREQRPARGGNDRRGGRNNNSRRGGRQSNGVNVNLQDDSAFPSLGAASA